MAKRTIEMKWLLSHIAVPAALLVMAPISCKTETESNLKKTDSSNSKNRNRLANESSPYLLQHADNPVDWYPWGKEALNKAKAEDKPIFLSIGYSACHWCHVMAHESFENPDIAALMNVNFINIKVDREERPDLDEIYMSFTTAMTGSGGWPMSVFLTPDLKPFYAGTYFPPDERYGRPGFAKVLAQLSEAYKSQKKELVESSENIFKALAEQVHADVKQAELDQNALSKACEQLYSNFDRESGGFGTQPKFPHPTELSLFLRQYDQSDDSRFLNAAELALKNMARGGIYDQIGGGFHRYATDNKWLVPHFEKMLYDNALLVPVYADAFQITNNDLYLKIIRETLDFLLREMTSPEGGFYSALDADSEGEEGKFYVWDIAEIKNALDEDAERFVQYFNVTSNGNFEGHNILNVTTRSEQNPKEFEAHIEKSKKILLESRSKRIRPHTDDKILTSWNGLAISAFCRGYQVTGERRFLNAATQCASFINDKLYRNGKLTHSYREGVHSGSEFLEDYSFLIRGLLDLYESDIMSGNGKWIEWAQELSDSALKHFQDEKGRFYLRPDGHEDLIFRPKEVRDGAIPSAGSIMLGNLLKLNRITGNNQYLNAAEKGLRGLSANVAEYPAGMASAVGALDYYFRDKIEIVISGKGEKLEEVLNAVYQRYLPNRVIAFDPDNKSSLPLFEGRQANSAEVRAYICRNSVCRLPVTTVEALKNQLNEL